MREVTIQATLIRTPAIAICPLLSETTSGLESLRKKDLNFFGDTKHEAAFNKNIATLVKIGGTAAEIDFFRSLKQVACCLLARGSRSAWCR